MSTVTIAEIAPSRKTALKLNGPYSPGLNDGSLACDEPIVLAAAPKTALEALKGPAERLKDLRLASDPGAPKRFLMPSKVRIWRGTNNVGSMGRWFATLPNGPIVSAFKFNWVMRELYAKTSGRVGSPNL